MPDIKEPGIISPASPTTPSSLPSPFPKLHKAASICSQFRAQLQIKLQQICLEEELLRPAVPGAITALSCRGRGESWQQRENRTQHRSDLQRPKLSRRESSRREKGERDKDEQGWKDGRTDRRQWDARPAGVEGGSGCLTSRQGDRKCWDTATQIQINAHTHTHRRHPSCRTGGNSSPVHCANASGKAATAADSLLRWVCDSSVAVREGEKGRT